MVKKIDGPKRGVGAPSGVNPTGSISAGEKAKAVDKAKGVGQTNQVSGVKGAEATSGLKKIGSTGIKVTAQNRAQLDRLLSEETSRLFENNILPAKDKEVLEKALKMAMDASQVDDED